MKSRPLGGDVVFAIVLVLTSSALVISGCSKQEPSVVSSTGEMGSSPAVFTNCAIVNGDFSQGSTGWTDVSEGPGLAGGIREITDVDGRSSVLHLDSRASGNYYLFYVQTISTCGIVGGTLTWDWKLAQIERSYGLGAVYVKFFNSSSNLIGQYFVRRDTGDFPQEYDCSHIISEICGDNPGIAVGCDRITGTAFDWETHTITFTSEFFNNLECNSIDPGEINSMQVWIESYNNAGTGVDAYFDNFVYTEPVVPTEVALDIKPGSCPNPFNPKSMGKFPVAILGAANFDVRDIDIPSLRLQGVVRPLRSSVEDVATAPVPEPQMPNLCVVSFSGPSSAVRGGIIGNLISLRIRNNGPVDASIAFSVGFYMSTDPVITTSDELLIGGREFVAYLRAGQETPVPLYGGARVPTNSPIGNVFLGVIVDEFGAVVEGDETDNTAALPIMITVTGDVAAKPKSEGRSLTSVTIFGQECDCAFDGADGYGDLTLKFQAQDIVDALGPVAPGDVKVLTITGALLDGTPFEASDCVVIVGGKKDGQLTEQGRIGTVSVR